MECCLEVQKLAPKLYLSGQETLPSYERTDCSPESGWVWGVSWFVPGFSGWQTICGMLICVCPRSCKRLVRMGHLLPLSPQGSHALPLLSELRAPASRKVFRLSWWPNVSELQEDKTSQTLPVLLPRPQGPQAGLLPGLSLCPTGFCGPRACGKVIMAPKNHGSQSLEL